MAEYSSLVDPGAPVLKAGDVDVANPLGAIQAGNTAASGFFDLRAKQANEAAGEAYRNAISEQGEFDPNKLRSGLKGDPRTNQAAGATLLNTQHISSDALNQAKIKADFVNNSLGALDAMGPNVTAADALSVLHQGLMSNVLTIPEYQRQVNEVAGMGNDPAKLRAWIDQHKLSAASVQERWKYQYGTPTVMEQGDRRQPGSIDIKTGAFTPAGGPVPVYADPSTAGAQVKYQTKDGAWHYKTWKDWNIEMGNDNVIGPPIPLATGGPRPPAPGPAAAPAPGAGNSTTNPRPGVAAPQGQEPRLTTVQPAPAQPIKRPEVVGPATGDEEAMKLSAADYGAAMAASGGFQQRVFPLVEAYHLIKEKGVKTGATAETVNHIKSLLMTIPASILGVDSQTIAQADFDKLVKYMTQYVNSQALSGRSDQAMASAVSGNPSAHISTLANEQILPVMIGWERMKQVLASEYRKTGGSPNGWHAYMNEQQNNIDPRVFMLDMLSPQQRTAMVNSMSTDQLTAFNRTYELSKRYPGVMQSITVPGTGAGRG